MRELKVQILRMFLSFAFQFCWCYSGFLSKEETSPIPLARHLRPHAPSQQPFNAPWGPYPGGARHIGSGCKGPTAPAQVPCQSSLRAPGQTSLIKNKMCRHIWPLQIQPRSKLPDSKQKLQGWKELEEHCQHSDHPPCILRDGEAHKINRTALLTLQYHKRGLRALL